MNFKRLTLFAGHYGSGKTSIAVNAALELKKQRQNVAVADLDIVNPYFRAEDSKDLFLQNGIKLICSQFANTNVDFPALPDEMYALTDDTTINAVLDIGGDERGALALGRIAPKILAENNYEMLLVINCYRPLTPDAESVLEIKAEIENACRIPFTGIVNNSNLGEETTAQTVLDSLEFANSVSKATGLPIVFTSVAERLYGELQPQIPDLFPITVNKLF